MPTSQDYVDDHDKEGYDDDKGYKLTPHHNMTLTPRPKSSLGGCDDASLNSMLGNLAISSPHSATELAACQNSRGPVDADAPPHDFCALYSLVAKFANVYALDPDNQAAHPPHLHAFYVNGCKVKEVDKKINILVVMMQLANPDDIESVAGKFSDDKK
jgi:hypothetical protein